MKKIAIISSHARSLIDFRGVLIANLILKELQVFVFAPNFDEHTKGELIKLGAKPIDLYMRRSGVSPVSDFISVVNIYLKLRELRPEVVLSYFIKPVIYGTLAAWLARVPRRIAMIEGLGYVFTYPARELSFKQRFLRCIVSAMYRTSLKLANRVVFLNVDDRAEFLNFGLVDERKAICINGIGIDLKKWYPVAICAESVSFLMIARLLREKGVYEYAEAAKYVKLRYPQAQFVLLGGGDENPGAVKLEQVSAWHEQGLLSWHGHVPVVEYMKAASVFVLPSYREGVPVSTMEAMAMGRPIITTDVPGCRETVVDGVNGFMVPAKDAVALAEKIIWFIENPSSIPLMGAASRKMAEKKFDVHKINETLMQIMLGIEDEKTV
jgi:glycosyltransferase involved in cell wall biosynthesis